MLWKLLLTVDPPRDWEKNARGAKTISKGNFGSNYKSGIKRPLTRLNLLIYHKIMATFLDNYHYFARLLGK